MAEGGGFDFNKLAQAMGLGMGGGQGAGEGTMLDDMGNKLAGLLSKLTGFIPNFSNPGQAGIAAQFDRKEGVQDKMINQGAKSMTSKREGGVIVAGLSKYVTRDSSINANEKESLQRMDPHIEAAQIGDSKYSYSDVSVASLGAFSSPSTPSSGISYDHGVGGVA